MKPDSFTFNGINSLDDWNIKIIRYDFLMAEKRKNKIKIPHSSSAYRSPGKYYDDAVMSVECILADEITRHDLREIAYELSKPGDLTFWDEPSLHYKAEIFKNTDFKTWPGECGREFTVNFDCYPFALSQRITIPIQGGINKIDYKGTYETPVILVVDNKSASAIYNLQITTINREAE